LESHDSPIVETSNLNSDVQEQEQEQEQEQDTDIVDDSDAKCVTDEIDINLPNFDDYRKLNVQS
jgi:hypothetical protein